jgi:hypothetical protein
LGLMSLFERNNFGKNQALLCVRKREVTSFSDSTEDGGKIA